MVLSSVAAERPRRANAVYGASKAGLDALARGLGDDLQDDGVRVLVVRPGFVHTRMTRELSAAPLATTPQVVARALREGLDGRAQTIWVPGRSTLAYAGDEADTTSPLSPYEAMSAARSPGDTSPTATDLAYREPDMTELRARRRDARRRRRLARVDLGLGALTALILLLATPGLAISASDRAPDACAVRAVDRASAASSRSSRGRGAAAIGAAIGASRCRRPRRAPERAPARPDPLDALGMAGA